jgi:hypothetical protein
MDNVPTLLEINRNFINYFDINDIINVLLCSKNINSIKTNNSVKALLNKYNMFVINKNKLKNMIPLTLFSLLVHTYGNNFDSYTNIFNIKHIDTRKRRGMTDYIDFLNYNDFHDNKTNILCGYDYYSRFFISIMYDKKTCGTIKNNCITTLFQRYKNNNFLYVSCGDAISGYDYVSVLRMDNYFGYEYHKLFFHLLSNNEIIIKKKNNKYITCNLSNIL